MPIYWTNRNGNIKSKKIVSMKYDLLDFLDAIYWEISFHNTPELAKLKLEALQDSVDQLERNLDD